MPELPEVETVVNALRGVLIGTSIDDVEIRNPNLRYPFEAAPGTFPFQKRIIDVRRRGRYVVVEFENLDALVAHLGMTGSFRISPLNDSPRKHDHVIFHLGDGRTLRYEDPRRFGFLLKTRLRSPGSNPDELSHLGPEPLSPEFSSECLKAALTKRKTPVKTALMNNRIVVGVGNIYANESLFAARINPLTPAARLSRKRVSRLVEEVKSVLARAVAAGGTTISDFKTVDGSTGRFHVELRVYGKTGEPCPQCGALIRRVVSGGRAAYFCPRCQRR